MNNNYHNNRNPRRNQNSNVSRDFLNPYNFVPVHDKYCDVEWANELSHDIPFSDGVSGKVNVKFKTESPLIIKSGNSSGFVEFNGEPFVPATSIKGTTRNNLEILTMSNISKLTKNNRYSMRDLSPYNKDYSIKKKLDKVKAGFLINIKGNYHLVESPEYERLRYPDIEEKLEIDGIGFRIKNSGKVDQKYNLVGNKPFYEYDDNSNWAIVLTGKMFNKKAEYGFRFPDIVKAIKLPENIVKDFRFIYEKETDSQTWKFWKKKIKNFSTTPTIDDLTKQVCWAPVFYVKENNNIIHMGLTFLYREPFKNSTHDLMPKEHINNKGIDLAEAIFGSSNDVIHLKGRVSVSHGYFDEYENDNEREVVLGSPKPTFFPFYLKQDKDKPFNTYSNSSSEISGWKRYLSHKEITNSTFSNDNTRIRTKIKPIKAGASFTTIIRFHNLKRVELGALLSALTFHNNHDNCFHLMGMGKPLGYGKIKVEDIKVDIGEISTYMAEFESYICDKMFGGDFEQWKNTVLKIFTYALENSTEKEIRYPKAFDEFKAIKKQKLNITDFSPNDTKFELKSLRKLF